MPTAPIFTWLFEASDGGTKVTLVVLEEDLSWVQNLFESVSAVAMAKNLHGMLAALKAGVESQASSSCLIWLPSSPAVLVMLAPTRTMSGAMTHMVSTDAEVWTIGSGHALSTATTPIIPMRPVRCVSAEKDRGAMVVSRSGI